MSYIRLFDVSNNMDELSDYVLEKLKVMLKYTRRYTRDGRVDLQKRRFSFSLERRRQAFMKGDEMSLLSSGSGSGNKSNRGV